MGATVLITLLSDGRVPRAIDSALAQGAAASQVLVADGGSDPVFLKSLRDRYSRSPRVQILSLPGTVARTRNQALPLLKTDRVAFLDADQVAPPNWLRAILKPLGGPVGFSGGPTRPLAAPRSRVERHVNEYEAWFYQHVVPGDLGYLPMGNSAWSVPLLRRLGGFDERLSWGGEDYDLNHRALASGAKGAFLPGAWVYHDQSHLDSVGKLLRRKYRYNVGASVAYLKNGVLASRLKPAAAAARYPHPLEWAGFVLKPFALWRARRYYRRNYR